MKAIDLNSDMGELPALLADGTQEKIMAQVSSVNVSCGAHAGDEATIRATLVAAKRHGLSVGAHPSYPDRANFGRVAMVLSTDALAESIYQQLAYLSGIAGPEGVELVHVKPHGALYHHVARGKGVAQAFYDGVLRFSRDLVVVGLAGSRGLQVARDRGFRAAAEGFMDRAYEPDGSLRSRELAGSLITDPELALRQALEIIQRGQVTAATGAAVMLSADTLCVHSDTPGSAYVVAEVVAGLKAAEIEVRALS